MFRMPIQERPYWRRLAEQYQFHFHTFEDKAYWDERQYYQFTLQQIEEDIEQPTEIIHQMCLEIVQKVVHDEEFLRKFQIPKALWTSVRDSWTSKEPSLYSRLDLAYHGKGSIKLYENNADTPTSLFETAFWQWLWLEDNVKQGKLNPATDQFNALQEHLIQHFNTLHTHPSHQGKTLYFTCCKHTEEDRATVQYLEDCAAEAGIKTQFIYIEDIGHGEGNYFTDLDDQIIEWIFKLYPWEHMFREEYQPILVTNRLHKKHRTQWLEPMWKSILSNKALLPMLWKTFPDHPFLLESYFEDEFKGQLSKFVKKPIFSREGANIKIYQNGRMTNFSQGIPEITPKVIYQAYHPLPKFGDQYALIGSWLINDIACGISIREDDQCITQDDARFIPHIILS